MPRFEGEAPKEWRSSPLLGNRSPALSLETFNLQQPQRVGDHQQGGSGVGENRHPEAGKAEERKRQEDRLDP
jgi:hypothetical protein